MNEEVNNHLKNLAQKLVALSKIAREANEELTYYTREINSNIKLPLPKTGTDFIQFPIHYEDKVVRGGMFTRHFLDQYDI